MKLNILISCYNESVSDVPKIFLPQRRDVRYIVSHQMSPDYADSHPGIPEETRLAFGRSDVVYSQFAGKGVSQNRNHCLDVLETVLKAGKRQNDRRQESEEEKIEPDALNNQLCLISDDDVSYTDKQLTRIIEVFGERPATDAICFRIATPEGQPPFKCYPDREYELRQIPVYGPFCFSSIEIAFRLSPVLSERIRFDENFGLGSSRWPEGGEETVFLSDCLKAGLRLDYVPEYLVTHPYESTGKRAKTVRKAQMLEAVAVRCRGRFSSAASVGRLRVLYRRFLSALHLL